MITAYENGHVEFLVTYSQEEVYGALADVNESAHIFAEGIQKTLENSDPAFIATVQSASAQLHSS